MIGMKKHLILGNELTDLNDDRDDWTLRVRICRTWESTNPKKDNELISLDMIFIDEHGDLIHAVIRKHLSKRFQHRLREGGLYSLRNLKITRSTGAYRPLSNKLRILFLAITSVVPLEDVLVQIPKYGFEFMRPELLDSRVNDNTILSDVVGCLCSIGGLEIVGGGSKKRDIKIITDYSVTTKITLWGKLGEVFDPKSYNKDGTPYVVIVTSTTVRQFQGEISFCTTNGSKVYINLDTSFVSSLRDRFTPLSKEVEIIENANAKKPDPEKEMFTNRMSIRELVEANWSETLEEYIVTVRATIMGIDNSFGWYYVSCKTCLKKVIPENGGHVCNACQKKVDYPLMLFKIHIEVMDGTSSSTFVLFNMVSERLVDMSVKKLLNNLSVSQAELPLELRALVGKDLIFKLRLNRYNLRDGFANYTVVDIFHPKEDLELAYESNKNKNLEAEKGMDASSSVAQSGRNNVKKRGGLVFGTNEDDDKPKNGSDDPFDVPENLENNVNKRGKQVVSDDDDIVEAGINRKRRNLILDDEKVPAKSSDLE